MLVLAVGSHLEELPVQSQWIQIVHACNLVVLLFVYNNKHIINFYAAAEYSKPRKIKVSQIWLVHSFHFLATAISLKASIDSLHRLSSHSSCTPRVPRTQKATQVKSS